MIYELLSKITLDEVSGGFADFSTWISLNLAMAKIGVINISSVFFWGGIINILNGIYFRIPFPLQNMKTITASSLQGKLNEQSVTTSGFFIGIMTLILGLTNTINIVAKFIPHFLICSIQVGQGLIFISSGIKNIESVNTWIGSDSYLLAISLGFLIVLTWLPLKRGNNKYYNLLKLTLEKIPIALFLFIIGIIIASTKYQSSTSYSISIPIYTSYNGITTQDYYDGFKGAISQLPLTLLNSIISLIDVSSENYPQETRVNLKSVSISIGLMNMFIMLFKGAPLCHGSGGLTVAVKMKAKTGMSICILGIFKIVIAIFLGDLLVNLLNFFPMTIIGIFLCISGAELSLIGIKKLKDYHLYFILSVGVICYIDLFSGFITGLVLYYLEHLVSILNNKYSGGELQNLTQIEIN